MTTSKTIAGKHPAFDLTSPPATLAAANQFVRFVIGLDSKPASPSAQLKWLRPYLAEAGGFRGFALARRQVAKQLIAVYPQLWASLKTERPIPSLFLPFDCEDAQASILSTSQRVVTERESIVGGYFYLRHHIELDANDLTEQYLLSRHPLPAELPIPLVLGLDPCFRNHFFCQPQAFYQHCPLHTLLHECLHANAPRHREAYHGHLYDDVPLPPDLRISEVVYSPLAIHLLLSTVPSQTSDTRPSADRTSSNQLSADQTSADQASDTQASSDQASSDQASSDQASEEQVSKDQTSISRLRLTPQSMNDLMEGVTDYLTEARLPAVASLIDDRALGQAPAWPPGFLSFIPVLVKSTCPSQVFVNRLTAQEVASLWRPVDDLGDTLWALLRQTFAPAQASALILWLGQTKEVLAASLAAGSVEGSPELAELLTRGWTAVARWLGEPAYLSPLSTLWVDL